MPEIPRDDEREKRLRMEIIVDANGPDEQASGWYSYLQDTLRFPFLTTCDAERATSPLRIGDEVEVQDMASEEECDHEMFITMRWERGRILAIPLSQLVCLDADESTRQAVEDWRYWVARGYEF